MLKRDITSELAQNFLSYLNKLNKEKNNNNYNNALELIDTAFKDIFKLSMKFFNSFTFQNIIEMTTTDRKPGIDKCIMIAKLLEEEAFILEKQKNLDDSFYINLKSLNIFLYAHTNKSENCTLSNYFDDIPALIENVSQYKLPPSLEIKIRDYHASLGEYDKADNLVYFMLEEHDYNNELISEALDFYNKLLLKSAYSLEKGGISKSEIQDSVDELKSRL